MEQLLEAGDGEAGVNSEKGVTWGWVAVLGPPDSDTFLSEVSKGLLKVPPAAPPLP